MILSYALNFAHEVQPHEHYLAEGCEDIYSSVIEHVQTNQHEHHSSDQGTNEFDEEHNDHSLPFPHSHFLQSHSFVQIRNLQTSDIISDLTEKSENIYLFRPPELIQFEIIRTDFKNFYQTQIASTAGLRAPPVLS